MTYEMMFALGAGYAILTDRDGEKSRRRMRRDRRNRAKEEMRAHAAALKAVIA